VQYLVAVLPRTVVPGTGDKQVVHVFDVVIPGTDVYHAVESFEDPAILRPRFDFFLVAAYGAGCYDGIRREFLGKGWRLIAGRSSCGCRRTASNAPGPACTFSGHVHDPP
jgi:hypothetical protein